MGMRAANIRNSMEKKRKPELLRTFLASFPIPRYSRPMSRPIPMCEVIRKCVRTYGQVQLLPSAQEREDSRPRAQEASDGL